MSIENRPGFEEEKNSENPDEIIIFEDGNHAGSYYSGKRSEMELLSSEEGGYPMEEKNPKLNEQGQIWAETKWDNSGNVIEFGWRDVVPIPQHWKESYPGETSDQEIDKYS